MCTEEEMQRILIAQGLLPWTTNAPEDQLVISPISRHAGREGKPISLLANYFKILNLNDGHHVEVQRIGMKGLLQSRHGDTDLVDETDCGVIIAPQFHLKSLTTQSGSMLSIDISKRVSWNVTEYILKSQEKQHLEEVDWEEAEQMLRGLMVKTVHTQKEFKVIGLSKENCKKQKFFKKKKKRNADDDITVYDYFKQHHNPHLPLSENMPCLDVGRPNKPMYFPLELCLVAPRQVESYINSLTTEQRSSLVAKSRLKPLQRRNILTKIIDDKCKEASVLPCEVSIEKSMISVKGRILGGPKLMFGDGLVCPTTDGAWNYHGRKPFKPVTINKWAIINFSSDCNAKKVAELLCDCAEANGFIMEQPLLSVDEDKENKDLSCFQRVELMFNEIRSELRFPPVEDNTMIFNKIQRQLGDLVFIICVLDMKKNQKKSDIYAPWIKKCFNQAGIGTQCIPPTTKYFSNLLLKINAKLGGLNFRLAHELSRESEPPTMILGITVSQVSPGKSEMPSIAVVVSSTDRVYHSKYSAHVHTQPYKEKMIDFSLKVLPSFEYCGIVSDFHREFLVLHKQPPERIIIFRDGVCEPQFEKLLSEELKGMEKAIDELLSKEKKFVTPKYTLIVVRKNHHTRLFDAGVECKNVPSGTVVDTKIVDDEKDDFYICAHKGAAGTSRPVRYTVLRDDIGISSDDLQQLVHSLCYVNQASTKAASTVAPIYLAHRAASQFGQVLKSDYEEYKIHVPKLLKPFELVRRSMHFV